MMERSADITALCDENAIRRLTAFYCDAVSYKDPVRAASAYAVDGRLAVYGAEDIVGREAIGEVFRHTFSTFSFMQQIAHAGLINIAENRATARWSIYEINRRSAEDRLSIFFGWYEDELVRLDEGWRFARRCIRTSARTLVDTVKMKIPPVTPNIFEFPIMAAHTSSE